MQSPRQTARPRVLDVAATRSAELLDALRAALDGGPPLLPVPPGTPGEALVAAAADVEPRPGTALLLPTSGSTGTPRLVELGREALTASATLTHDRLGGPGRWLLSLPLTHVAGWQVVVRSLLGGSPPAGINSPAVSFTAAGFLDALATDVRYASLVPAQLLRVLDDADATSALAALDAVLVGGAATPEPLRQRALEAGVHVVRTYGMTETAGGCVYDGLPLDGVDVHLEDDGRVVLSGPTLASGYLTGPQDDAVTGGFTDDAGRRFRTGDRGRLEDGRLQVVGRLDDQLVTGGVNVSPQEVEAVVGRLPSVREVVVVGVPDETWGQAVVAVVTLRPGAPQPSLDDVRTLVRDRLGAPAAPRRLVVVSEIPTRGIGKPDRAAVRDIAVR